MSAYPEQEPLLNNKDYEYGNEVNLDSLINEQLRKGFIVKVYSILLIQILTTSIFIFFAYYSPLFYNLFIESTLLYIFSILILIITFIILICYPDLLKKVPYNYIFLGAFTLSEAYFLASFTCQYTVKSVLIALILTITTVVTLTIYASLTKTDFTIFGGLLFCLLTMSIVGSIILIFVEIKILKLIMDIFVLLLFAGYLIYDTQLIVKSYTKYQFSIDDYIIASLNLCLDIINIFIRFLGIFGEHK